MGRGTTKNGQYKTASKDPRKNKLRSRLKKLFGAAPNGINRGPKSEDVLADIRANLDALELTEEEALCLKIKK